MADSWERLKQECGICRGCALADTRTHVVFGDGCETAEIMLIGEGPGQHEDEQGIPFVGRAGQLLDDMLEIIHLDRTKVYIANVVKCRPPSNRNPRPAEIEACSPFLREQVRSIWPDVIVCLGNFASQWVLKTQAGVTSLRGQLHQVGHFLVCPTFHPAACIYHPDWLPLLESDLAMVGQWLREHPKEEV